MSAWTVWQVISGAPERMGPFASRGDALRVFRTTAKRRSAVYRDDARHEESEDLSARDGAAMDAAVRAWFERAAPVPAPAAVVELPAPEDDHVEPVGVGAATEAPLPVAFEPPVVELCEDAPHPLGCVEKEFTIQPTAEVERLRIALADATARAVAAEDQLITCAMHADERERGLLEALAAAEERVADLERQLARTDLALAARDRTIANLRAELAEAHAHPVVRIAAPVRRRAQRAPETAVQALWRRLAERAEGRR